MTDLTPNPITNDIRANTTTSGNQVRSSVAALDDGSFITIWESSDGGDYGIFGQRFNSTGAAIGGEFRVNTHTSGEQSFASVVGLQGGGFVVTWSDNSQDGSGFGTYGQRYNASGNTVGVEFRVNTYTVDSQLYTSAAALDDGGFVVTWASRGQDGNGWGIYGQRYDANGAPAGVEFRSNTHTNNDQYHPSVAALDGGGFVVTWDSNGGQDGSDRGIFGQRYNASGTPVGSEFGVNTTTISDQLWANVAGLNGGGFVVTWSSLGQDGGGYGVYGQLYAADGTTVGSEFRVNTVTAGDQNYTSATALADGGFIVSWSSYGQDGSEYGVYGQRFNANGTPVGDELRLNQTTNGSQIHESWFGEGLAVLTNGTLVSTWHGFGGEEIYVRLFELDLANADENLTLTPGNDTADGGDGNDTITGGTGIDTIAGSAGNDVFVVIGGDTASGESYDGGTDTDTLQIDGGGTVDLTGVTFTNMENVVVTNATGTRVILSTSQVNAFSGTLDAQGASDTFVLSDFALLGILGAPATRAAAFELIQDLHAGSVENVEWQEGGATNVATVSGGNIVVLSSDPAGASGGLSWATSVFTFDADGNRLSKVTTMDDGSVITRTFGTGPAADIVLSDVTTGIAGAVNSTTTTYDTAGRVNNRTVTYDDGRSNHTEYDDSNRVDSRTDTTASGFATTSYYNDSNQRVSVFSDDSASNQYSWLSSTLTLDPLNGQVTQKFTVLDDGNTITENYSGGLLTSRVTQDGGANEAFTSATQHYAAGVFQWQATVYDSGKGLIQGSASSNSIGQNSGVSDAITGNGGADVFVFSAGMGADRILDFSDGADLLDLTSRGINSLADFSAVGASLSQAGGDVVINFGGGDVLTLKNFLLANLSNADFNSLE